MFRRKANSFITETLLPKGQTTIKSETYGELTRRVSEEYTNNLTTVSALYIYTGTPPHGYGTQAPKVAETVIRAYEYNRKKSDKEMIIGGFPVQRTQWEAKDGAFPHNEIHGNFLPSVVREMTEDFLTKYCIHIDNTVNKIIQKAMCTNSDILTRGRQTFCPFTCQSVTSAQAYENAYNFLSENTGEVGFGVLEWIQHSLSLFEKNEITYQSTGEKTEVKRKYNRVTKQHVNSSSKKTYRVMKKTSNVEETRSRMREFTCRFASYIKHKERGKKDRRAIASGTAFLRMLLYIVEEFHLELSKQIPGSTISIGGEEKKAKILNNLNTRSLQDGTAGTASQGTEDATKWNECVSPGAFALMHLFMFEQSTRLKLGLPQANEHGRLFSQIAILCNFFQTWKEIQLGPGIMVNNESEFSRISWKDEDVKKMNSATKEWYAKISPLISEDRKFVKSSPGMLMGMLNAGSTTLGMLPANYRMDQTKTRVVCMRSSDDSMTKYLSIDGHHNKICISQNKMNLSLIGINLSPDKTFFFVEGFGEYTSWYMSEGFVSQFGTEIPSIRPQGKNPNDDLYFCAKSTSVSLQTLNINHIGASAKLRLGIKSSKDLWRIPEEGSNIRNGVSLEVQLIEDGGKNLWNCCNCHLQEYPLKELHVKTQEEKDYLLRIINPENPFSETVDEEMVYSKEKGSLDLQKVETPRTIFNYMKRSNRTFKGNMKVMQAEKERMYDRILKLVTTADPSTTISFPKTPIPIHTHIMGIMQTMKTNVVMSARDEERFQKAIDILENGWMEDEEDNGSDEEDFVN